MRSARHAPTQQSAMPFYLLPVRSCAVAAACLCASGQVAASETVHGMPHRVYQVARAEEALSAAGAAGSRAGHPGLRLRVQPQGGVPAHAGAPGAGARRRQAVRGRRRSPPSPGGAAGTQAFGASLHDCAVRTAKEAGLCRSRSSRSAAASAGASPQERRRPVRAARSALLLPCRQQSPRAALERADAAPQRAERAPARAGAGWHSVVCSRGEERVCSSHALTA